MYKIINQVDVNIPNNFFVLNTNPTRGNGRKVFIDHVSMTS